MVRQYFITSYYVTAHHRIVGSWMSKKKDKGSSYISVMAYI